MLDALFVLPQGIKAARNTIICSKALLPILIMHVSLVHFSDIKFICVIRELFKKIIQNLSSIISLRGCHSFFLRQETSLIFRSTKILCSNISVEGVNPLYEVYFFA